MSDNSQTTEPKTAMEMALEQISEAQASDLMPERALPEGVKADPKATYPRGGYQAIGNYLHHVTKENKTRIATAVVPLGRVRNENGNGWGKRWGFYDPDGIWREITIIDAELLSDPGALIARLADYGLWIDGAQTAKGHFVSYLTRVEPMTPIVIVTRPGWHEIGDHRVYVSPLGQVIGTAPDGTQIRLAEDAGARDREKKGTLKEWCALASLPFTDPAGCYHWLISLMLGVAGAVTEIAGLPNSGIMWSGQTSRGKSIGQRLQCSAVGNPRPGKSVFFPMRATSNALENLLRVANGSTLALDETSNLDSRELKAALFMLAGELSKARQQANGELREQKDNHVTVSLSGEFSAKSIVEHVRQQFAHGVSVRYLDIDVTNVADAAEMAEKLRQGVAEHYGHALPVFVQYLFDEKYVEDPQRIVVEIELLAAALAGKEASAPLRRAASVMALFQWCGQKMQAAGLLPLDDGVETAIKTAWEVYQGSSAGAAIKDMGASIIENLQSSIASRWDADIIACTAEGNFRPRVAFYDEDKVYILADKIAELAGGTLSESAVVKALDKAGVLLRDRPEARRSYYIPGSGRARKQVAHYQVARTALAYSEALGAETAREMVEKGKLPLFGEADDPIPPIMGENVIPIATVFANEGKKRGNR